ncbi:MAG: hypothetical protein ACREGA_04735 [Candidatus Saccharimonadales bacterium]
MVARSRLLSSLIVGLIVSLFGAGLISSAAASAQSVTQSYKVDQPLQVGLMVRLAPGNKQKVATLDHQNASQMFGVVINPTDSSITLSQTSNAAQAYVATSGNYNVLVDTQNGPIKAGDYIGISSLDGIGDKAGHGDKIVLGKALGSFNGSNSLQAANLKNTAGQTSKVQIGHVAVSLGVTHNPKYSVAAPDMAGFLGSAAKSLTGRPVSAARIYLALAVLIFSVLIAGSLLYAGVKSSIIAVGRNPLSKKSIFKSLLQITLSGLSVLIIGLLGVYLLIRF